MKSRNCHNSQSQEIRKLQTYLLGRSNICMLIKAGAEGKVAVIFVLFVVNPVVVLAILLVVQFGSFRYILLMEIKENKYVSCHLSEFRMFRFSETLK